MLIMTPKSNILRLCYMIYSTYYYDIIFTHVYTSTPFFFLNMFVYIMVSWGSSINHVDTKGGGGISQMSMFVYVGGGGSWMNVYVDIISHFSPSLYSEIW